MCLTISGCINLEVQSSPRSRHIRILPKIRSPFLMTYSINFINFQFEHKVIWITHAILMILSTKFKWLVVNTQTNYKYWFNNKLIGYDWHQEEDPERHHGLNQQSEHQHPPQAQLWNLPSQVFHGPLHENRKSIHRVFKIRLLQWYSHWGVHSQNRGLQIKETCVYPDLWSARAIPQVWNRQADDDQSRERTNRKIRCGGNLPSYACAQPNRT